ncbi:snRNA-activating protein of 50kDa MW C terminal-domain-containing protein [Scenedesmus sp. NREL 46B-D3]|nr:snRNA-activating protein of 50kDa MW C terminal-domain-containing protein [Scenedesmus sp. NREL 46B-D3]
MADLAAAVQQGLAQQQGVQQLSDAQLAAALDVSDLRMPYFGGTAQDPQQPLLLLQPQQPLVFAGQPRTATAAAAAMGPAAAAAARTRQLQQQQQQQQEEAAGPPASIRLLASYQEALAAQPTCYGAAAAAPPAAWAGSRPAQTAAAAAGSSTAVLLQPGDDVVVTIQVFETGLHIRRQVMQELQVLGSSTLAELRDAIICPLDRLAEGMGAANAAAYFLLDGSFYDDTRAAAAADCSELVAKWAAAAGIIAPRTLHHVAAMHAAPQQQQQQQQQASAGAGAADATQQQQQQQQQQQASAGAGAGDPAQQQQQQQQHMQATRIADLCLQVSNRPMGLFSHQGCCEHQVQVADVRLLHKADALDRRAYPRTLHRAPLSKRYQCGVCNRQGALTLLLNHPEAPESVMMLCAPCEPLFDMGRYSESKKVALGDR